MELSHPAVVPSLATARHVYKLVGYDGEVDVLWKMPNAANPAFVAPVPADHHVDLQTFFFGPMSHSLTLRPFRNTQSGCCSRAFKFDIAGNMFGPPIGNGEIAHGCCSNDVTVNFTSGQVMHGNISRPLCGFQHRVNLDWSTGENVSYRFLPCTTLCGPWRTGYVGTAPGEEDQHQIRYWDVDGKYISCSIQQCCIIPCTTCCRVFCSQCACVDRLGFTTWHPLSLAGIRERLQREYAFVLKSSFGEPAFEINAEHLPIGTNNTPHLTDINALGNLRINMHKSCGCCWKWSDPSDTADTSAQTAMDLTFRGTFNQNQLDSKDFALALGYLILNNFHLMSAGGGLQGVQMSLPRWYLMHSGMVLPHSNFFAQVGGNKMV